MAGQEYPLTYNGAGSLTSDASRRIARIDYDCLNNPVRIQFTDGNVTRYVYSATGEKLRVIYQTAVPNITVAIGSTRELMPSEILYTDSTDYLLGGSLTLRNGKIDKYLFDEGYCQAESLNATQDNFMFYYYDRDHLGNVRQVTKAAGSTGTVVQTMNYYPFGALFCDGSANNNDVQPYKYNGKELDKMHGLNTYDYGARQYNPITARWDRMDPLAEKYYGLSPYVYCMNNPVMLVDPDGKEIEDGSIKEWNKLRKNIESKRDKLQSRINNLNAKAEKKGWSSEKLSNKTGNLLERVTSLNNSLNTMIILEKSNQVYRLSEVTGIGYLSHDTNTNIISINFVTTENFVHEMTHAGQFETGDIAFLNGGTALQDIYDEVAAYKAQFAYNPFSVSALSSTSPAKSFEEISPTWVQGLKDGNGNAIYAPRGAANTGIFPVNINSTRDDIIQSYPWNATHLRGLPSNIRLVPGLYYKR